MKNVIFIAPPAAGKGTQSDLLVSLYNYKHISTGDLLREEIATESDLGKEIDAIISKGDLVSDELITKLLTNKLKSIKDSHFILDGYPRNISQAKELDKIFKELNIDNYSVLYLDIDKEVAMKRATGRIICSKCNAIYHLYTDSMKPKVDMVCDKCEEKLYQRPDDTEVAFNKRFDTYLEKTAPLIEYYKEQDKLSTVKVCDEKEDTLKNVLEVLEIEALKWSV